ncbi:unnamed protein product [Urochloa decumbens]|uniref:MATH domain-containing protein n=1 Tax=Urochloa decumbens TaxID=240449 RepID=A0ABC8YVF4_9POAL
MAEPSPPASIPFVNLNVAAAKVFRLKVQCYMLARSMAREPCDYYESDAVSVGGYDWAIRYYPSTNRNSGFGICLVLPRPNKNHDDIAVSFACTLLEKSGEPSVEMEQVPSDVICGGDRDVHPNDEVICCYFSNEALEKFIVGDSIAFQCTISILKKPTKSM